MSKWSEESHRRMVAMHHDHMARSKYRGSHLSYPGGSPASGPVAKIFAALVAVFMVVVFLLVFAGIGLFVYMFVTVGLPLLRSAA